MEFDRPLRLCRGCLLAVGAFMIAGPAAASSTLAPADTTSERSIVVTIHARSFDPATVTLQAGQKTRLVFQNEDAELHAFVPAELFKGVNLSIGGNGAPEFTPEGFKRVIIPAAGVAEIRFVPERRGEFPYICDMPGHEMKATILVQ
jgi:plastocyanin